MDHTFILTDGRGAPEGLNELVNLPIEVDTNPDNFSNFFWDSKLPYKKVEYGTSEISQNILYSKKYYDCCGLVLLGNKWGALSHMDVNGSVATNCDSPEKYVNKMVDCMLEKSHFKSIVGIPIGGVSDHMKNIEDVLRKRNVRIGNCFSDNYPGYGLPEQQKKLVCYDRAILVNPATQLVVVQANFSGHGNYLLRLYDSQK